MALFILPPVLYLVKFVLQESLPKIPYLTAFDKYLRFSFIFTTLLYLVMPIVHYFDDCPYETDHCDFNFDFVKFGLVLVENIIT